MDSDSGPIRIGWGGTSSLHQTVKLWDPESLENVQTNTGHCLGVVSVAIHPSGRIAASASIDSFICVFDVFTNNTIATLKAMEYLFRFVEGLKPTEKSSSKKFVLSVAWSADGRRIACGSMDGTISVFDVARAKFLHQLEGHCMPVRSLVYSPVPLDGRVLFSASDDGHVHVYDIKGKSLITSMSGHASWVLSVDVTLDGQAIATGSSDKSVRLWDLKMRTATQILNNQTECGQ